MTRVRRTQPSLESARNYNLVKFMTRPTRTKPSFESAKNSNQFQSDSFGKKLIPVAKFNDMLHPISIHFDYNDFYYSYFDPNTEKVRTQDT